MIEADRVHSTPPTNSSAVQEANPRPEARAESGHAFPCQPAIAAPKNETRTGESANRFDGVCRRSVLAALALLPAALPVASLAAPADPIFELIETHRGAVIAWNAALTLQQRLEEAGDWDAADAVAEKPCHDANGAFLALVAEPAITRAGLVAKLAYFQELLVDHETNWTVDECVVPSLLINSFAASLKNIGVLA